MINIRESTDKRRFVFAGTDLIRLSTLRRRQNTENTMATRVGFIGLGNMGKPMAINLAKAGVDLMVYDLRPEPMRELAGLGAKCARSADEIGNHAEIIEIV